MSFLKRLFGDENKRIIAKMQPIVGAINAFEPVLEKLTDSELKNKTNEFKERLAKGETLDDILPEAYATVREASKRTTGMRHFDVQMLGGIALHRGNIAEMRTGEGKTLVATLPIYLNALEGKGAHVVTVNDYLAKRDAVWMAKIYDFLGMSVGVAQNLRVSFLYDPTAKGTVIKNKTVGEKPDAKELEAESEIESFHVEDEFLRSVSRQEVYRADITYGTNNEFGFDYLRDNMVQNLQEMVMRPGSEMRFAVVDEVDSILIDEARTPLIISSPAEEAADKYYQFAKLVRDLRENEDYNVDEKMKSATLTDEGINKFEKWLGVGNFYEESGIQTVHHVESALKAQVLFKRDKDYIVDGDEIMIIDEHTGRKMPGRRYSEGLHQALEAKEGLPVQRESQTLATITFQNLFRMYDKLAGMTGTAATESEEFFKIYALEVITVPTNKSDQRFDFPDRIYKTEEAKFQAVLEKIKECRAKDQPILVGTISVEKNERLSKYLEMSGVPHEILNAKNHEREGEIIAQAGRPGAITLATNMAGRGVDIKLGGVPATPEDISKVINADGLFVLGTERHESRRIDNQLRGRAARQGDPGQTQFFVSTEDDLMRIFAGDRLKGVMTRLRVPDDMPIEQKMITRMLESAQKKVESHNFDIRKHLLEYDDVLNRQRTVIYSRRRKILELAGAEEATVDDVSPNDVEQKQDDEKNDADHEKNFRSLRAMIMEAIESEIESVVSFHTNVEASDDWDMTEIIETMKTIFPLNEEEMETLRAMGKRGADNDKDIKLRSEITEFLISKAGDEYARAEEAMRSQFSTADEAKKMMNALEKGILLRAIDSLWVDHLVAIDYLRAGIGLRGYGQRDPLIEYKKESFDMFNRLLLDIQREVVYGFFKINIGIQLAPTIMATDKLTLQGAEKTAIGANGHNIAGSGGATTDKIGRNDPCHCGSGKKFKKCHGS
ncbi:MAG: preprotein translocase subunit SecA [Patescibacteria group bacterium]